ncbi:hypothetical protein [Streptomyces sp. NPDC054834]
MRRRFEPAQAWMGTLVGVAAFGLSVYNLLALRQEPVVDVSLPHIARIAQGEDTWLYFQPTLSARVKAERVEVITQVELRLRPATAHTRAPVFFWDETGSFSYSVASHRLTCQRVADPSAFLVSQGTPQQPLLPFNALGWGFAEGRYDGSLVLRRAGGQTPLREAFCVMVSRSAAATWPAPASTSSTTSVTTCRAARARRHRPRAATSCPRPDPHGYRPGDPPRTERAARPSSTYAPS